MKDKTRIAAAEIKFITGTSKYIWIHHERNEYMLTIKKELVLA
jgi:hypothetical protein